MREVTVLLVEDNPDLLELLLQALPAMGPFRVYGAADGVAGLLKFEEIRPDCVIVDVRMPELNGYQFVRILRGDPATAATPLIILTALTQDRDRFVGLASGADLFLTKPAMPFDLAQAIQQVIARTEAERYAAYCALAEGSAELEAQNGI
jgi:two-component system alkaline phosphatase synthesis response regulator PhoP